MNRRKFVTTTALVLPSVAVLGAISTQPKTYRSATSLYSNEDMTEWCNKNGMFYAKDNELNKKFFNSIYIDSVSYFKPEHFNRDVWIHGWTEDRIYFYKRNNYKFLVRDIYKTKSKFGFDLIAIDFVVGKN